MPSLIFCLINCLCIIVYICYWTIENYSEIEILLMHPTDIVTFDCKVKIFYKQIYDFINFKHVPNKIWQVTSEIYLTMVIIHILNIPFVYFVWFLYICLLSWLNHLCLKYSFLLFLFQWHSYSTHTNKTKFIKLKIQQFTIQLTTKKKSLNTTYPCDFRIE